MNIIQNSNPHADPYNTEGLIPVQNCESMPLISYLHPTLGWSLWFSLIDRFVGRSIRQDIDERIVERIVELGRETMMGSNIRFPLSLNVRTLDTIAPYMCFGH